MHHIISTFLEQVKKDPFKKVLFTKKESMSFGEIHNVSEKIMNLVNQHDSEIVPFYIINDFHVLPTVIGIMKAGKIPLPLPTSLKLDQVKNRISDINYKIIISDGSIDNEENVFSISEVFKQREKEIIHTIYGNYTLNNSAYIIMTSGTTGTPKKVVLSQKNLVWIMQNFLNIVDFNEKSRFLFTTPYTFDVSLTEIFAPVFSKGSLYCFTNEDDTSKRLRNTASYVKDYQITHLSLSPSYAEMLCDISDKKDFISLKKISLAGETFPYSLLNKFKGFLSDDSSVYNFYGPSETTVYATYYQINGTENKVVPIGKPIKGVKTLVLDENYNEKRSGELFIGGEGVATGYINSRELTEEKFITLRGERYYRTGDYVTVDSNENLVFNTRKDDQVQVNGIRVELEEINSIISSLKGVSTCKTVYYKKNLISFIIINDEITYDIVEQFVRKNLQSFIQPRIIIVDEFILNQNRKLDTKKMLEKYVELISEDKNFPNVELDIARKDIRNLLTHYNAEKVHDLNSIQKIKFIVKLEKMYNCKLDESILFLKNADEVLLKVITDKSYGNRETQTSDHMIASDEMNLKNIFGNWYSEEDFEDTIYQTLYVQKNYDQKKYNSVLSFDVQIPSHMNLDELNKIFKKLITKIDILQLALYKNDDELVFKKLKLEKVNPLIYCLTSSNNDNPSFHAEMLHAKHGSLLYSAVYYQKEKKMNFYFSHHILDKSSLHILQDLFTKEFNEISEFDTRIDYLDFISFINSRSKDFALERLSNYIVNRNDEENLAFNYQESSFQYFKLKLTPDWDDSFKISKRLPYIVSKIAIEDNSVSVVSGSTILNIREFEGFDARHTVGDIHSTIPFFLEKNEDELSFSRRFDEVFSFYKEGINFRNMIYIGYPKITNEQRMYKDLWDSLDMSVNYLGEIRDPEDFMKEIITVKFRKNYVIAFTHNDYLYAVLIGSFAQKDNYIFGKDHIKIQTSGGKYDKDI